MRKLATIRKIDSVEKHPNADKLDICKVGGWNVITKRDEFKSGDYGVYFEIDSFLPKKEPFLFLEGRCNKKLNGEEGYRLKTIKLRGVISQGLLLPLNLFSELKNVESSDGTDVTETLRIKKYEKPEINSNFSSRISKSNSKPFPSFIPKTDQERLQNLMEYFETKKEVLFEVTKKLDGTSLTIYYNDGKLGVCSRNLELEDKENIYWSMVSELKLDEALEKYCQKYSRNLALQGELCGPNIQKNRLKLNKNELFTFDIYDIDNKRYCLPEERVKIFNEIAKDCKELKHVPIVEKSIKIFEKFRDFESLHDYVSKIKSINDTIIEGLVFKSCEYYYNEIISFKVVNNNYLLKVED